MTGQNGERICLFFVRYVTVTVAARGWDRTEEEEGEGEGKKEERKREAFKSE